MMLEDVLAKFLNELICYTSYCLKKFQFDKSITVKTIIFVGRKYWTIDILLSVQANVDTMYMSDVVCKEESSTFSST